MCSLEKVWTELFYSDIHKTKLCHRLISLIARKVGCWPPVEYGGPDILWNVLNRDTALSYWVFAILFRFAQTIVVAVTVNTTSDTPRVCLVNLQISHMFPIQDRWPWERVTSVGKPRLLHIQGWWQRIVPNTFVIVRLVSLRGPWLHLKFSFLQILLLSLQLLELFTSLVFLFFTAHCEEFLLFWRESRNLRTLRFHKFVENSLSLHNPDETQRKTFFKLCHHCP